MTDYRRLIEQTRSRIGIVLGLRAATAFVSGWLLAWGIVVLAVRGVLLIEREPLLWGTVGVVVAAALGMLAGMRRRPSVDAVRAMLDSHWNCGGLLMATADIDTGRWPIDVPDSPQPRIRWNGMRPFAILLCCGGFVLASFLIPVQMLSEVGARQLIVGAEVEKLAEKIELLQEEKILPPERAQSLELALERLQQEASGNDPAKTWEAMDHLEQAIAQASAEAAEQALRSAQAAANAQELAAALDKAQADIGSQKLREAMRLLAKDVRRAAQESSMLQHDLQGELQQQLEQDALDPEQLGELAESLGNCKACDLAKLKKLAAARLIDASLLELIDGNFEIDPDALAELLCECKDATALAECIAACSKPGRGGVSRGRGDAPLTWKDPSNRDNVAFKEQALSPGKAASLKESRLQGISVGAPTADDNTQPVAAGGGLDASAAGQGSARTQVILPEHRKAVQRYFAREPAGNSKPTTKP